MYSQVKLRTSVRVKLYIEGKALMVGGPQLISMGPKLISSGVWPAHFSNINRGFPRLALWGELTLKKNVRLITGVSHITCKNPS